MGKRPEWPPPFPPTVAGTFLYNPLKGTAWARLLLCGNWITGKGAQLGHPSVTTSMWTIDGRSEETSQAQVQRHTVQLSMCSTNLAYAGWPTAVVSQQRHEVVIHGWSSSSWTTEIHIVLPSPWARRNRVTVRCLIKHYEFDALADYGAGPGARFKVV